MNTIATLTITEKELRDAAPVLPYNLSRYVVATYVKPGTRRGSGIKFRLHSHSGTPVRTWTLPFRYDCDYVRYVTSVAQKILGTDNLRVITGGNATYTFVPDPD